MQWVTRTHILLGFLLPSRGSLFLTALAIASILTFQWEQGWSVIAALIFMLLAIVGFIVKWIEWRSFSLSITQGESAIWERRRLVVNSDQCINLRMVGSVEYHQTLMGQLFNYGTLTIGALGGPYEWRNIGRFRTLRRIIESNGEWIPRQWIIVRVPFFRRLSQLLEYFHQLWNRLVSWWRQRSRRNINLFQTYRRLSPYARFLRYTERFFFPHNVRLYEMVSPLLDKAEDKFTSREESLYKHILKLRHILIDDLNGGFYRHPRIHSIRDIQKSIPADWFEKYSQQIRL